MNRARGEKNGRAKLTWDKIDRIRQKHRCGQTTIWLAIENQVAQSTISNIVTEKTWRKKNGNER